MKVEIQTAEQFDITLFFPFIHSLSAGNTFSFVEKVTPGPADPFALRQAVVLLVSQAPSQFGTLGSTMVP